MRKFRLIVAGSRTVKNKALIYRTLDSILKPVIAKYGKENIEIVCGKAKGPDSIGEEYAIERGLAVAEFPADWDRLGKRAGYIRNEDMAFYATHCVIFWDGVSKGSKHMADLARKYELKYVVFRVEVDNSQPVEK